jgi:hypothetical protein
MRGARGPVGTYRGVPLARGSYSDHDDQVRLRDGSLEEAGCAYTAGAGSRCGGES